MCALLLPAVFIFFNPFRVGGRWNLVAPRIYSSLSRLSLLFFFMPPPYHNCSIGSTDDNLNIFLSLFLSVTVGQYRSILCLRETFTITNLQYYSIGNMHSVCVTHSNTKIKNFDSNFEGSPGCHTHRVWQRSRLVSLSCWFFFIFFFQGMMYISVGAISREAFFLWLLLWQISTTPPGL